MIEEDLKPMRGILYGFLFASPIWASAIAFGYGIAWVVTR